MVLKIIRHRQLRFIRRVSLYDFFDLQFLFFFSFNRVNRRIGFGVGGILLGRWPGLPNIFRVGRFGVLGTPFVYSGLKLSEILFKGITSAFKFTFVRFEFEPILI